ncbi:MAG: PQQ-dependent sugar dehydrogenase [Magnetovibrio sp.]|nr:PQQ-dependent sugar dehydrogenase [Magnetovibrio sp.]
MRRLLGLAAALGWLTLAPAPAAAQGGDPLARINLPDGFKIELYARVPKARTMVLLEDWGVILVGSRGPVIHAVIDEDRDGRADAVGVLFDGLKLANGIDWKDGWFYVAEQHRLVRYRAPDLQTLAQAKPEVLYDKLVDDPWHGWRYARFGPDGMLYVAIGVPCNICEVSGLEGTIVRFKPTGGAPEIYASGIRNSVGFAFQPGTGELYFTDNGADNMGDDSPPDEFNYAPRKGLWFGFPWYGGGKDRTPDFRGRPVPRKATFPVVNFGAHVAALGVSFYTGSQFPPQYRGDAFVAQHGSWNRSIPDGYRVTRVKFDKKTKKAIGREIFAEGWLGPDGEAWGRPVDVKEMRDGSLLVSDDRAGAIYRIRYVGK